MKIGLYDADAGEAGGSFSGAGETLNSDNLLVVAGQDRPIRPLNDVEVAVPREAEFRIRNPGKLPDPKMPSKEEVEPHYLTYLPFRNWCQYCIQGKGKVAPHFKQKQREDGLMEVRFDYCFTSTHGSPLASILVAREKSTNDLGNSCTDERRICGAPRS